MTSTESEDTYPHSKLPVTRRAAICKASTVVGAVLVSGVLLPALCEAKEGDVNCFSDFLDRNKACAKIEDWERRMACGADAEAALAACLVRAIPGLGKLFGDQIAVLAGAGVRKHFRFPDTAPKLFPGKAPKPPGSP